MAKRTKKILVKHGSDKRKENSKRENRKSNKTKIEKRKEESRKIAKIGKEKSIRNIKNNCRYSISDNYRDMEKDY
jgi:hypothetical protein